MLTIKDKLKLSNVFTLLLIKKEYLSKMLQIVGKEVTKINLEMMVPDEYLIKHPYAPDNLMRKQVYPAVLDLAKLGNYDCIRVLSRHGISFNVKDKELGITPLMIAAYDKDFTLIKILVEEAKVSLTEVDKKNRTVLHYALFGLADNDSLTTYSTEILDYLLKKSP